MFYPAGYAILDSVEMKGMAGFMKDLDNNRHSVFLMYYHLILVVKYRRKVIDDTVSSRAKEIFLYIAENYGIILEEWNHDRDHVHIMFRAQPKTKLSKFMRPTRVIWIHYKKGIPFMKQMNPDRLHHAVFKEQPFQFIVDPILVIQNHVKVYKTHTVIRLRKYCKH